MRLSPRTTFSSGEIMIDIISSRKLRVALSSDEIRIFWFSADSVLTSIIASGKTAGGTSSTLAYTSGSKSEIDSFRILSKTWFSMSSSWLVTKNGEASRTTFSQLLYPLYIFFFFLKQTADSIRELLRITLEDDDVPTALTALVSLTVSSVITNSKISKNVITWLNNLLRFYWYCNIAKQAFELPFQYRYAIIMIHHCKINC